jgi:hypothetical protein
MVEPTPQARIEQSVLEMRRLIAKERFRRADQAGFLEWLDMLDAELSKFASPPLTSAEGD